MNKKIKNYVDVLFSDIPKTIQSIELKEELLSNMNASMEDYLSQGVSENQAYSNVIANLGDIDDLLNQLPKRDAKQEFIEKTDQDKKNILFMIAGIFMILLGTGSFVLIEESFDEGIAILVFFIFIGLGAGLLIYANQSKIKTVTFEEDKNKNKNKFKLAEDLSWAVATLTFFIAGFAFGQWGKAWIIFPLVGISISIVKTILQLKES